MDAAFQMIEGMVERRTMRVLTPGTPANLKQDRHLHAILISTADDDRRPQEFAERKGGFV
jgi:hypothetical protein